MHCVRAMRALLSIGVLTVASLFSPRDAQACGGCFAPPESVTVVTDHRMILSISKTQTTLYDQIRYQGDPEKFAWVLPIAGTVEVGLSADVMFASLDALTTTTIVPPPRTFCPGPPVCGRSYGEDAGFAASDGGAGSVEVTKREVVGPFETVQLKATDPMALGVWLAQNGFSIPQDITPIIDQYQKEGFGFLAMKLLPGQGIDSMRPVRITMPGASPTLPLRMVAAGTGQSVGITLWIVGEGRYEPANFPSFVIPTSEISWSFVTNSSNYTYLRQQKTLETNGSAWEIESSLPISRHTLAQYVRGGGYPYGDAPASLDYLPVTSGPVMMTAEEVRQADLDTLFAGIPDGSERITRIRADLARAALGKDLVVGASQNQDVMSNVRQLTGSSPIQCPSYPPCAPGDGLDYVDGKGGGCALSPHHDDDIGLALAAGFIGIALMRARRKYKA